MQVGPSILRLPHHTPEDKADGEINGSNLFQLQSRSGGKSNHLRRRELLVFTVGAGYVNRQLSYVGNVAGAKASNRVDKTVELRRWFLGALVSRSACFLAEQQIHSK